MKLFTDIFDAIEKAFNAVKAIAGLPNVTRDELRTTFDETFKLLDTSLNMVSIRLGEILRITDPVEFETEVQLLKNDGIWITAEREFRLCKNLRHTVNEAHRLRSKFLHYISIEDWDEMTKQMHEIIANENTLSEYIADKFEMLSKINVGSGGSLQQTRSTLKEFQDQLNIERRRLIDMEIELYDNF